MRITLDKLRWVLAGGSLALVLLLAGFAGYGRYKALRQWKDHLKRFGHIEKQTDGFTYSQSQQGRTVFTLHAAKAIQHDEGKVTLHDVVITLYGQGRVDRIYGNQFEYDDKQGIARAVGDVQMDLQAPGALAKGKGATGAAIPNSANAIPGSDAHDIHVRTSGVVYVKKLGVAATPEQVNFSYLGLDCAAKGAEFDTGESIVHLLANVELHGDVRGRPLELHAGKADLDRNNNTATLQNAILESRGQHAEAANALFHLRTDGSVEAAEATGNVVFLKGTQRIAAARANGTFDKDNHPQHARLIGNVTIENTDPSRLLHGRADDADAVFDSMGSPQHITATGRAEVESRVQAKGGMVLRRTMRGNRMEAAFTPGHAKAPSRLTDIHVAGSALATGESPASPTGLKTTQIAADDLRAAFVPGAGRSPDVKRVLGEGNTRLQQDAPLGEQQISTGDHLQIAFAPGAGNSTPQVASATQTGHVQVHSVSATRPGAARPEPVVASADKSSYDGQSSKLLLAGSAHFAQGETSVAANELTVDQRTGDSEAEGNVLATFNNSQQPEAQAAHVRSSSARLQHESQAAQFRGTDAQPARLWQGASQVEAATLFLDAGKHTLAARPDHAGGLVHAVFAGQGSNTSAAGRRTNSGHAEGDQVARVTAAAMDYDDAGRAATFSGNVHVDSDSGQAQSQHAVAFLSPPAQNAAKPATQPPTSGSFSSPMAGSLQRIVMWGSVNVKQPGRDGRGERMVYTAADQSFLLTGSPGKPPQVVDAKQGNVTGAALLFKSGDSTIIVSGPSGTGSEHGRVRTETGAKQ